MSDLLTKLDHFICIPLDKEDDERHIPEFPEGIDAGACARDYLSRCDARFADLVLKDFSSRDICRIRSNMIDRLLISLFERFREEIAGCIDGVLVAVGGYGREEMSLASDIDLLFLSKHEIKPEWEALTQKILYVLWDLKLEIGYAVRSLAQAKKIMREDATVLTSMVDARWLAGERSSFDYMVKMTASTLKKGPLRENLFRDKIKERDERLAKYGSSVYICEPNLKEGEGGLRDMQLVRWLAKFCELKADFPDFKKYGFIDADELAALEFAFEFFLRVRNELHVSAGRKSDQLTFDGQEVLAKRLGFTDQSGILAVERFMQTYYTVAAQVSWITRVITRKLVTKKGGFRSLISRLKTRKLDANFRMVEGHIAARSRKVFDEDPSRLMDLFVWVQKNGAPIHEETKEWVLACLPYVTDAFRALPRVCEIFKSIMGRYENLGHVLFAMHEVRFFDALIPEFRKLRNRVQHDVYHVYTVDTHSIFAVNELSRLQAGFYGDKFPSFRRALKEVARPDLLTFGLLFHDIGKGEGGNHSVVGANIANKITSRLGYPESDQRVVEFLVISHLLMPHLSQRRDLEDPVLIENFASSMKSLEAMNNLYVLTWADIRAVGPEAWTDWKGSLLERLYDKTRVTLTSDATTDEILHKRIKEIRAAIVSRAGGLVDIEPFEKFIQAISPRYVLAHTDEEILGHYRLLSTHDDSGFLFDEKTLAEDGTSQIILYTLNNPRVLALITGVMLSMGINILSMEVFRLTTGSVFIKLRVQTESAQNLVQARMVDRLKETLRSVFTGKVKVDELIAKRQRPAFLQRKPVQKAKTNIAIDNDVSAYYTVIDVFTHDRLGLLYDISKCLSQQGCYVEVSKISTKVEQVVDSFYVKDIFGHKITAKQKLTDIKQALETTLEPKEDTLMLTHEIVI